jgi:hypothetical protein
MQILHEEHYFYTARRDEAADEYFLEVLCGTVAVFTITIKLTKREIAAFRENPESLRVLAQKIADAPDKFFHRRV